MNNEKRVVLLSLTILALLLTGFTWAYWNSGKVLGATAEIENTIKIGEGDSEVVETNLNVLNHTSNGNLPLVPKGYAEEGKTTSVIEHIYVVEWTSKSDSKSAKGYKIPSITNNIKPEFFVLNDDQDSSYNEAFIKELNNMFTIEVKEKDAPVVLDGGSQYYFTITVSFDNEPVDQVVYEALNNNEISYKFTIDIPDSDN